MKRLGIIIPAYNTGENIRSLLQRISDQVTDEVEVWKKLVVSRRMA